MLEKMQRSGVSPNATGDDRVKGLDLMSLVVNPNSFCETVENLFDLSFLVKDSKATIQIDEDTGLPTCRLTEPPEEAVPKTQNVVVLSMQDCKDIGDLWGISRPELERDDADAPASPAE